MAETKQYIRFTVGYRVEHWVLAIVFTILAITGLSQMYAAHHVSQWIVGFLGGVERVRVIHRTCAILLIAEALFHVGVVQYRIYVTGNRLDLLPGWQDAKTAFLAFFYNLNIVKNMPVEGRFTFAEKAEYWAVAWGTVLMGITGFMMWNPVTTTRFLSGEFLPAARIAHGLEAVLAALAIIVWHLYFVLVKTLNRSMFTGYLTEKQMEYEHALELLDLREGHGRFPIDARKMARWKKVILPAYLVFTVLFMLGIFALTRLEKTSIGSIVPPEDVTIYSRLAPEEIMRAELPRPLAAGEKPTWANGIGMLLTAKCGSCHGSPLLMGGLNLTNYQGAIAGGVHHDVVAPGDAAGSLMINKIIGGGHPGRLSQIQLAAVRAWINTGAPEGLYVDGVPEPWPLQVSTAQPEIPAGEQPAGAPGSEAQRYTWENRVGSILRSRCGSCHGEATRMSGLNLTTYAGAMAGGTTRVIIPGNPDSSKLITKVAGGGHPGRLSAQELDIVKQWIASGAPGVRRAEPPPETPPAQTTPPATTPPVQETPVTSTGAPEILEPNHPEQAISTSTYTWEDQIGAIFQNRCSACHGDSTQMSGLKLTTYETAIAGGRGGAGGTGGAGGAGGTNAVIIPGKPDDSILVQKMEAGGHPGQLTDEELAMVRQWILIGAPKTLADISPTTSAQPPREEVTTSTNQPETPPIQPETPAIQPETPVVPPETHVADTWNNSVGAIFGTRCGGCHGLDNQMVGLSFATYQDLLKGSANGPVLVSGDPDTSKVITKVSTGNHPGHFSDEELALIRAWILAGAPEG